MACSNPIKLYKEDLKPSKYFNHSDFTQLALRRSFGHDEYMLVPCRHCLNCRVDRINEFVDKAEYEYCKYGCGAFVTFTYDDTHLFKNSFIDSHSGKTLNSINKKDGKDFLNRLNKLVHKEADRLKKLGIENKLCCPDYKYVISSEYGDKFSRSHFHCLFFGLDFAYCERLFWRAWNFQGSIQVGAIKNGGIAYCVKYISEQSYGIDDFYKYTYHHLEKPSSSHSLGFGEGLYLSQLKHIKETGCYKWHNIERPLPAYYKNKYKVISDLDDDVMRKKYVAKKDNIYSLYETRITSYKEFKMFNIKKAQLREKNIKIKLRQSGKQVYEPSYTGIERDLIGKNFNRLLETHDKAITKVINNQGKQFLSYKKHLIPYPMSHTDLMKYFHIDYNHLCKAVGFRNADLLLGRNPVPF